MRLQGAVFRVKKGIAEDPCLEAFSPPFMSPSVIAFVCRYSSMNVGYKSVSHNNF